MAQALLNIGGVDMPSPSSYKVILQDMDSENTRRSETGILKRDRIRAAVYKIEVSFRIEHVKAKIITDALSPAEFPVVFFDFATNSYPNRIMYTGDRSSELVLYKENNPDLSLWELSTSLIEY